MSYTPGFGYHKNDLVNIGQHNYATAPAGCLFVSAAARQEQNSAPEFNTS